MIKIYPNKYIQTYPNSWPLVTCNPRISQHQKLPKLQKQFLSASIIIIRSISPPVNALPSMSNSANPTNLSRLLSLCSLTDWMNLEEVSCFLNFFPVIWSHFIAMLQWMKQLGITLREVCSESSETVEPSNTTLPGLAESGAGFRDISLVQRWNIDQMTIRQTSKYHRSGRSTKVV